MKKTQILTALLFMSLAVQAQMTLENLLSAPFPSALTVSPDGKRIAWVFNDKGSRNIYVAEAPAFTEKKITTYQGDDGQDIASLVFTPDNNALVFVRGGAPNSKGEIPNPVALQTDPDRALWLINIDGTGLRKLGKGSYPKISPKGNEVAFLSGGQVWMARLDSAKEAKKLFQVRGTQSLIRWSPNGTQLAFVSGRGDHAFIGTYTFSNNTVRLLDTSVDHDIYPVWSPDGKSIAYIRTPNVNQRLPFGPEREGHPWSIRKVDVATGKAIELWKAKPGRGSVLHDGFPTVDNFLWWVDDKLVFPWEADGWQHLYAIPSQGGEAILLTPGNGEVENVSLSLDRKSLLVSTNIADIDRRHIYRVSPATAKMQAVITGEGIEWSPVETTAGIVCLRSGATSPAWPVLVSGSTTAKFIAPALLPKTFPAGELVIPKAVEITATDGMKIPGQLFLPKNHKAGEKHPAVIFFHGGSRRQMLLGFHHGQYYHNSYALNQYFASQGYVVLSLNYRSGIGYGLEFREALEYGAVGASEYRDVEGAGLYLAQHEAVEAKKIGLWGGSYGGYLTTLGLAKASDLFACGVDIHGVHDWNVVINNFVPGYDAEKRAWFAKKAFESSPMNFISTWKSPVLLIHGDDDRNVPFSETVSLAESLRTQGVYFEQIIFPDEVHSFLLYKNWLQAYEASADFFKRQFKK
jgi:dipeptidyl aminopeptidase/acylaminoacyl peptidase